MGMKSCPRIIVMGICAALVLGGCKQADRAKTTDPTLDELPTLTEPESTMSANIGVDDRQITHGRIIVPTYKKIEPTAEEKKILGIKEEPPLDELVLYRPPPRPEQGISADSTERYSLCEAGGMLVGRCPSEQLYSNYGYAGRYYDASIFGRVGAAAGPPRDSGISTGIPWTMLVGECYPRQPAARETRRSR
jgi:hypothetical protein